MANNKDDKKPNLSDQEGAYLKIGKGRTEHDHANNFLSYYGLKPSQYGLKS